ncbi:MAG: glycosyltransferase [Candidatus Peribacteraceae bacterium]|nr:glycosyltransferase [Candidatus Peribacteraceae bacterium]
MKIALIADWLPTFGGAEHVIAEFHALWPDAPIFTTVANHGHLGPLDAADIRTGILQPLYRLIRRHELLLPWMPRAMERMDLRGFDCIISSSHAVGKGIVPPSTAMHICYCHTPMRYAWEMEDDYLRDFSVPKLLHRSVRRFLKQMRRWDLTTAKRVDIFIANSSTTQERIRRVYGRESMVIPPPVDDRFFLQPLQPIAKRGPFLAVGRLVPYKKFDLLVALANARKLPLIIAGRGQEEKRLKRMAGPTVTFLGFVPDADLPALYASAKAVLFPPHEDAGIVPLEAQACGTPVIALGSGGALDTVQDGRTGIFFREHTVDSLLEALRKFEAQTFDPATIREHARQFSADRFRERILGAVHR